MRWEHRRPAPGLLSCHQMESMVREEGLEKQMRERTRKEIGQLTVSKWVAAKRACVLPLSTFKSMKRFLAQKPALDQFPKGLAVAEFYHLIRCRHNSASKQVQQEYSRRYDELRDRELDPTAPLYAPEQVYSLIRDITDVKVLCGIFALRRTFTDYRRMLMNFMKLADSIEKLLMKNIAAIADLSDVAAELTAVVKSLETLTKKEKQKYVPLPHFIPALERAVAKTMDVMDPVQTIVLFHSLLVSFKMDCMLELVIFSQQTDEWPFFFYPKEVVSAASQRLCHAFRLRDQNISDKKRQELQVTIRINKCIIVWSKNLTHRILDEHKRLNVEMKKKHEQELQKKQLQQTIAASSKKCSSVTLAITDKPDTRSESPSLTKENGRRTSRCPPVTRRTMRSDSLNKKQVNKTRKRRAVAQAVHSYRSKSDDSDSDHEAPVRKRVKDSIPVTAPPVMSLVVLRRKANHLIDSMESMIEKLKIRRSCHEKYCEVSDQILKGKKCKDIRYYKEFERIRY